MVEVGSSQELNFVSSADLGPIKRAKRAGGLEGHGRTTKKHSSGQWSRKTLIDNAHLAYAYIHRGSTRSPTSLPPNEPRKASISQGPTIGDIIPTEIKDSLKRISQSENPDKLNR